MNDMTLQEAVEQLEEGVEITLECDGYSYEVSEAHNWVGGDGQDGYISAVLGNRIYNSAEQVLKESIQYLEKNGNKVVISL